jgi:hypothetical protein
VDSVVGSGVVVTGMVTFRVTMNLSDMIPSLFSA